MPTGTFQSYSEPYSDRTGGGSTGAASQPKVSWGDPGGNTANSWSAAPTGGSYTGTSAKSQPGYNQFPAGQGPSAVMPGSIAQYPDAIFNPNGGNPYSGGSQLAATSMAQQLAQGLFGPQQILLDQQLARQQQQLGMVGLDTQHQQDVLRRDNTLANQLLGLDRQGLGLERTLAQGQLGNLGKLRGILDQRRGIAGEVKGNTLTGLQIDEDKARDMASRQTWDLRSDLTQRGAFNTVANERGTGRIDRDLGYNLRGIENQRAASDITYRNTLLGLNEQGISYDNQQLALNNKLANIGLDYKRLDISQEQLQNSLADGLYNTGLAGMVNINQILDAMGSTNQQQAGLAGEIFNAVLQYSNLPPNVVAQWMSQMYGGTYGSGGGYQNTTGSSGSTRTGGNYGR